MNYKTRMLNELVYITKKIALLEKYIENKNTSTTGDEVLKKQLEAMMAYQECLMTRISKELEDEDQVATIYFQGKPVKEEPISYKVNM